MNVMRRFGLALFGCLFFASAPILQLPEAKAQDKPIELNFAVFPFPSMSKTMADTIIAKGFDRANGLVAKPVTYGTAGALWAAVAKGELIAHNMGAYTLPQIRSEGVNIAIY